MIPITAGEQLQSTRKPWLRALKLVSVALGVTTAVCLGAIVLYLLWTMGRPIVISPELQLGEVDGTWALCDHDGGVRFPREVMPGDLGVTHVGRSGDIIAVRAECPSCDTNREWALIDIHGTIRWTGSASEFAQKQASDQSLADLQIHKIHLIWRNPNRIGAHW